MKLKLLFAIPFSLLFISCAQNDPKIENKKPFQPDFNKTKSLTLQDYANSIPNNLNLPYYLNNKPLKDVLKTFKEILIFNQPLNFIEFPYNLSSNFVLNFNFKKAVIENNEIQNVILNIFDNKNRKSKISKIVSLKYNTTNDFSIKPKKLNNNFLSSYPSFIAFNLKDLNVKDFFEVPNYKENKDISFQITNSFADDYSGTLKLEIQILNKNKILDSKQFLFSGFQKISEQIPFEVKTNTKKLLTEIPLTNLTSINKDYKNKIFNFIKNNLIFKPKNTNLAIKIKDSEILVSNLLSKNQNYFLLNNLVFLDLKNLNNELFFNAKIIGNQLEITYNIFYAFANPYASFKNILNSSFVGIYNSFEIKKTIPLKNN